MRPKQNIKYFEKIFNYLSDPELRLSENGDDLLVIKNAEISGVNFIDLSWKNIHFVNCDFLGIYEIKLKDLKNTTFEDCFFSGVISWGKADSLRYLRCKAQGRTIVLDYSGSKNVRFEDCQFQGHDEDKNNWGGIGSRGDASFFRCNIKFFLLAGYKRISLADCETQNIKIWTDSKAASGENFDRAEIIIQSSNLRGKFDMTARKLQSVVIQNTNIDFLDMRDAEIVGNVLVERVRGGYLNASAKSMGKLTMSQCQIFGKRRKFSFEVGLAAADEALIDQCNFGSDLNLSVGLGAGGPLENDEWQNIAKNKSTLIRNSTFSVLDASWLESHHLRLENNTIESLDISNSRIGKLDVVDNRISLGVNFKNTQVKESTIQPLAKGQAKLDGSNIRLN